MDRLEVQAAYGGSSAEWAAGPARIYRRMAGVLVEHSPIRLVGARVLDFGAGTGATTAALVGAGADVVATDLTFDMLRVDADARPPPVAADALALPFRSHAFDASMGAFVISHIPVPADALREAARVTRAGGVVMTLGFDRRWELAEKETIDGGLLRAGACPPACYAEMKQSVEPLTSRPDRLARVAREAGLADVVVVETAVDVGVRDARDLVAWRTGNLAFAPFMASLSEEARRQLVDELSREVGTIPAPPCPSLLVLVGRVP